MSKKRRSVFNTDQPKKEILKEAKSIEKKALENKVVSPSGDKKRLYVDAVHHSTAKVKSAKRSMKLSEYVEWLIDKDDI